MLSSIMLGNKKKYNTLAHCGGIYRYIYYIIYIYEKKFTLTNKYIYTHTQKIT